MTGEENRTKQHVGWQKQRREEKNRYPTIRHSKAQYGQGGRGTARPGPSPASHVRQATRRQVAVALLYYCAATTGPAAVLVLSISRSARHRPWTRPGQDPLTLGRAGLGDFFPIRIIAWLFLFFLHPAPGLQFFFATRPSPRDILEFVQEKREKETAETSIAHVLHLCALSILLILRPSLNHLR